MESWASGIETITLFFEDLPAARQFYRDVFAAVPVYEDDDSTVVVFGGVQVNLLRSSAAGEVLEPATAGAAGTGPRFLLTIKVDDVDTRCAELAGRGVTLLNGPIDRPWGVRTAAFQDPGGHVWELAQ